MDIEQFLVGKYSPLLQENIPMTDEDKYMPLLFLVNTYHTILKDGFSSCNDSLLMELAMLQKRIVSLLKLYDGIKLAPSYNADLKNNKDYIENTFPKTTQTLKEKCNIHV